ncbi:hypothetical protein DPEC_G00126230 [Dallia pectoralis]|uniref:Uncharacterized protein n=1 Tax=Dallia pectoralis TaxID=75939 RepID=A0ACC2GR57_DALPE|nr:hypothetical protein DPEC_G00126230 [Dallia pectoralis]
MRRPPTSDEDTDGEQQSGPFVPELSTSTPPRRDEPLMELTSDEEDQDGEQQPEPLVLPVTKDGRETVQSLLDFAVPKSFSDQDYHRSHVDGRSYADVTREGRGREPTQVFYQRRTRGRGYSNWDREQVRSRQRRDRYEPRKEETRRRFYDGANRYDRAAKQNGGNDRYRHGGQQPNNVVNRNRNRYGKPRGGPRQNQQVNKPTSTDTDFTLRTRIIFKLIKAAHHLSNVTATELPVSIAKLTQSLTTSIKPAAPNATTLTLIEGNAKYWAQNTIMILRDHYQDEIQNNIQILIQLPGSEWAQNFDIASAWASSHFGRRLKRETLREVRAQLVQRLAGAPSSRPADGGDDAIQPATQSDPERTTAQHSQQTLDVPVRTPASVSIPAMAQSRLIVTAEIHPPPRGQRSPEILMTPTPSAVPGQVTTGTNMEQGGDWSPDIQHSSPPGFPSPGRSSPTLQTPREQRPARGPRQPPGGTTAVPEYPVSAPSRRDEPMRRPPTSDEDTDGEQQSGPFVPELSTSTPPRRDEPLMELTSDEEDQDGEQQPEPLVLPVTKDDYHRSHVDGRSYADVTREGRGREPTQVFYQRRTRGRGYSNWDREQVRSRQRRDRYEPRKEETRRRFYDGANRYDRAAKQNGGNDRYRHGGQQPNNVVNRNRNRYGKPRGGPRQNQQDEIQNNIQILIQLPGSEWAQNFDIASAWASSHFGRRLKRETLRECFHTSYGAESTDSDGGDTSSTEGSKVTGDSNDPNPIGRPWSGHHGDQHGAGRRLVTRYTTFLSSRFPLTWEVITYTADTKGAASSTRAPTAAWGTTAVPEYPVSAPSRRDEPMRRPPTSDEDTDGEQQSGPFVPELSTSTPPRRDEPLMELTSDEEDQDGEQQPEPLVLPVTKDGRETVQSLLDFAVPKRLYHTGSKTT